MVPSLSLLGTGKLGKTLGRLWQQQAVFEIQQLWSRHYANAKLAGEFIGAGRPVPSLGQLNAAQVWLIATPDTQIAPMAQQLAAQSVVRKGDIVFHCSGALPADTLSSVREQGAFVASVHPLHSFADPQHCVATFAGSYCAVEGDAQALALLRPAFAAIGAHLFDIDGSKKTLYHTGSVMACNHLVALLDASLQAFAAAGIKPDLATQFLQPIVHQTVDNTLKNGSVSALTGPIARGDYTTVKQQLTEIDANDKSLGKLYRALSEHALSIAAQQENVATDILENIKHLLHKVDQ